MNITYIKLRHGKMSIKDPILHLLKEILPNDKVSCAEIPDGIGLGQGQKIELALGAARPELIIGCGDTAELILMHAYRPSILINPSISQEDMELFYDDTRVKIIRTESPSDAIDKEFLEKNLVPLIDSLRPEARNIEECVEELVQLAHSPTDKMPENFDFDCDILQNLKKYRRTAGLSELSCPDCGHQMISFFVSSPDCTWARLCGRAGRLTYCPMCKTQHGFCIQIMS